MELSCRSEIIFERLKNIYGVPKCALEYSTPFQLLIAVILSAQCTDTRVNIVTKELFSYAPSAKEVAKMEIVELEKVIHSCGFFREKAKNIIATSQAIVNVFGQVPSTVKELTSLPGVGNKTASVIRAEIFGEQVIPVDTHVGRLARRMGLSANYDPDKIQKDLETIVKYENRIQFHHLLIIHGRNTCISRKPKCEQCILDNICQKVIN